MEESVALSGVSDTPPRPLEAVELLLAGLDVPVAPFEADAAVNVGRIGSAKEPVVVILALPETLGIAEGRDINLQDRSASKGEDCTCIACVYYGIQAAQAPCEHNQK